MQKTIGGVKNALLGELLPGFSTLMDGISGLVAGQDDAGEKGCRRNNKCCRNNK